MRVQVVEYEGGHALVLNGWRMTPGFTEHDLRDLEFVLAQRRAMSRRCEQVRGEHTCAQYLGHAEAHLCRACTESWRGNA